MSPRVPSPRAARVAFSLALACSIATGARDAAATDAADKSAAESLFRSGRVAMEEGRFAEACPKLAESQRLDPAAGTLMNLAECYAKNGQTASAWVTFTEAARASAARRRDDWQQTAAARARELEAKLPMLVIEVDPAVAKIDGLDIRRDGSSVLTPQWGTAVPVDPGKHTITADAPGRRRWSTTATAAAGPSRVVVRVVAPEPSKDVTAQPVSPAATRASADTRATSQPTAWPNVGIAALVAGGVGLVTGIVTGTLASSAASDADRACPTSPCSDRAGLDANRRAHLFATVSTVGFVAGGVLAATGVAILLFAPSSTATASPGSRASMPNSVVLGIGGMRAGGLGVTLGGSL